MGRTKRLACGSIADSIKDRLHRWSKNSRSRSLNEPTESHRSYSRTIWVHATSGETPDLAGGETHDSAGVRTGQAGGTREPCDRGNRRRTHREGRGNPWRGGGNSA